MSTFAVWTCEHLEDDSSDHFKLESGRLPAHVPRDAKVKLCGECQETYRQAGSQDGSLTEYLPPVPEATERQSGPGWSRTRKPARPKGFRSAGRSSGRKSSSKGIGGASGGSVRKKRRKQRRKQGRRQGRRK